MKRSTQKGFLAGMMFLFAGAAAWALGRRAPDLVRGRYYVATFQLTHLPRSVSNQEIAQAMAVPAALMQDVDGSAFDFDIERDYGPSATLELSFKARRDTTGADLIGREGNVILDDGEDFTATLEALEPLDDGEDFTAPEPLDATA